MNGVNRSDQRYQCWFDLILQKPLIWTRPCTNKIDFYITMNHRWEVPIDKRNVLFSADRILVILSNEKFNIWWNSFDWPTFFLFTDRIELKNCHSLPQSINIKIHSKKRHNLPQNQNFLSLNELHQSQRIVWRSISVSTQLLKYGT